MVIIRGMKENEKGRGGYPWWRRSLVSNGNGGELQWWCSYVPALLTLHYISLAYLPIDGATAINANDAKRLLWWRRGRLVVAAWFLSRGGLVFLPEAAIFPSHCLCCVFSLLRSFISLMLVVLMLTMIRVDGCCSGDKEGWWWWPSVYPMVASVILWVRSPAFLSLLPCFLFLRHCR